MRLGHAKKQILTVITGIAERRRNVAFKRTFNIERGTFAEKKREGARQKFVLSPHIFVYVLMRPSMADGERYNMSNSCERQMA